MVSFSEFVGERDCPDCGHDWGTGHVIEAPTGWDTKREPFQAHVECLSCECEAVITAVPRETWN